MNPDAYVFIFNLKIIYRLICTNKDSCHGKTLISISGLPKAIVNKMI